MTDPTQSAENSIPKLDYVPDLPYLVEKLINNVGSGIYLVQDRKFAFVNHFLEDLSGYSASELVGCNSLDFVHPDDREQVRRKAVEALKGVSGAVPSYEYRFIKKSGEIMWVIERISSIEYRGRRAVLGSFMDINRRKLLEEALVVYGERYRNILERMQDSYYELDLHGNFIFVNYATCKNLGYEWGELNGINYRTLVPEENRKAVFQVFHTVFKSGEPNKGFSHQVIKKDGSVIFVESSISLLLNDNGKPIGFNCVSRNITERIKLEEALARSEFRYRSILDQLQDSYYEVDLRGHFTFVNNTTCINLGMSREELIGHSFREVTPDSEIEGLFRAFNEVYRTGIPNRRYRHMGVRKNGEIFYAETSIDLARDENGNIIGFRALGRDVTERKKLEDDLIRSEEKYRTILSEMEDAYYEVDLKGNFTFVNDACLRDLRCSQEDLLGVNFSRFVAKDEVVNVFNNFNQVYRTGEPNRGFSHRVVRKDGTTGYVEASVSLIKNKTGKVIGFRAVSRDVTERKKLEQKLAEMATHDYLTGLPNRILLNDRFYVAVAHADRNNSKLAVMSLDLDSFKAVNDTMGHSAGDELLRMAAVRLSYTLRTSDTVARIGGDEFVLLLQDIHDLDDATSIATKIVESFKTSFVVEGHYLNISTSIGLAIYPDDGIDLDILMRKSDAAMYHSKKAGGSRFKVFSDSDRQELKH